MATEETPAEQAQPVPGSPEYNAQMIARRNDAKDTGAAYDNAEESQDDAKETPQKPEGVPEKFLNKDGSVNVEALAKSYTELEKSKSQGDTKPPASDAKLEIKPEEASKIVTEAGLDYQALSTKIAEKGQLDDGDYEALKGMGIPRELVDEHIALQKGRAEAARAESVEYIGGEEATTELLQWAAKSLSPDEVSAYNDMLAGPQWKAAVDTLKVLKGQSTSSKEPNMVRPSQSSTGGASTGYQDKSEMQVDMGNPLYHDPTPKGAAFRKQVQAKMANAAWRK